jgi:predicted transcriptional regulator
MMTLTTDIVSAYAAKASLSPAQLNDAIGAVANALRGVSSSPGEPQNSAQVPAVPIRKSVTPDFLVCLEDGKKLKMLKRHLKTAYGMTPAQYRTKWGLPHDYPMTAPRYAAERSTLAKAIGLGKPAPAAKQPATKAAPAEKATPKRGRPRKGEAGSEAS